MKKYQLKIMIKNSKPPIWRRCVVPAGISFSKLSEFLNIVMGWSGKKTNEFEFYYKKLYLSDSDREGRKGECLKASEQLIDSYMEQEEWFTYTYDLEHQCQHRVTIEEVLEEEEVFASVMKFKGNCPAEDQNQESVYDVNAVNEQLKAFSATEDGTLEEDKMEEQLHGVMEHLFSQMEEEKKSDEVVQEEPKAVATNYYNDFIHINRMNLMASKAPKANHNVRRTEKKIYPNDPCICGSGKKYKHCCKGK